MYVSTVHTLQTHVYKYILEKTSIKNTLINILDYEDKHTEMELQKLALHYRNTPQRNNKLFEKTNFDFVFLYDFIFT